MYKNLYLRLSTLDSELDLILLIGPFKGKKLKIDQFDHET